MPINLKEYLKIQEYFSNNIIDSDSNTFASLLLGSTSHLPSLLFSIPSKF
jgi:hypothetical protein